MFLSPKMTFKCRDHEDGGLLVLSPNSPLPTLMTVINKATLESHLRKHLTVHLHGVNTGGCRAMKDFATSAAVQLCLFGKPSCSSQRQGLFSHSLCA